MRKVILFASKVIFLAEQCLRGHKAEVWRVMAEWLKTPYVVLSRDLSLIRLDSSWKIVGAFQLVPRKTHY